VLEPVAWIVDGRFDPDLDRGLVHALHEAGLRWVRIREVEASLRHARLAAWRALWPAMLSVHGDPAAAVEGTALHDPEAAPPPESPGRPYGRSVHSVPAARAAFAAAADYVTFGHVWPTSSHPGREAAGIEALERVVTASDGPVRAIGGVCESRVADVRRTGACGFDVVSAIATAADPPASVGALLDAWRAAGN